MYAIETLTKLAALDALRPQWQTLWRGDAQATPFQVAAWLLPWAHHFAPDRTRALALYTDRRLAALVPFFTWHGKLLLAGTGPSDYGDGVFADRSVASASLLLERLAAEADASSCDVIDLQQLPPHSPLLSAAAPPGWRSESVDGDVCPVAALTGADGLDGISVRQRKDLAYAARALRRHAECRIELARADELDAVIAQIAALHAQRWGTREESGIFTDPRMRAFIDCALRELATADILRLHVLRVRGEIAAAAIVLRSHTAACLYTCTFDTQWSRYSPGLQTIAAAMRHAASDGAREFHFLRGQEAYKYRLGATAMRPRRRLLARAAAPLYS